jgi:hypothetical protein
VTRLVECATCGRVLSAHVLWRHERTHGDPRERLLVPRDEQDTIVRLYRRGGTFASVARETYWSKSQVRRVLLANGVALRPPGGRPGPKLSVEETLRRTQLYGRGLSIDEVAQVCGVTRVSIQQTLKREGVHLRPVGVNRRWERRGAPAPVETT